MAERHEEKLRIACLQFEPRFGKVADNRARSIAMIEQAAANGGFTGAVAFRDEPAMPVAAFHLEWADGRAEHDPDASAARVAEALTSALAAEAGHAEPLSSARSAF